MNDALVVQQPQAIDQRSCQPFDDQHHKALVSIPLDYFVQIRPVSRQHDSVAYTEKSRSGRATFKLQIWPRQNGRAKPRESRVRIVYFGGAENARLENARD